MCNGESASDADRGRVVDVLHVAAGEGRNPADSHSTPLRPPRSWRRMSTTIASGSPPAQNAQRALFGVAIADKRGKCDTSISAGVCAFSLTSRITHAPAGRRTCEPRPLAQDGQIRPARRRVPEKSGPGRRIVSRTTPEGASADSEVRPDPGSRPYAPHHRKTAQAGPEAQSPSSLPITRLENGGPAQYTWAQIIHFGADRPPVPSSSRHRASPKGRYPLATSAPDERSQTRVVDKRVRTTAGPSRPISRGRRSTGRPCGSPLPSG